MGKKKVLAFGVDPDEAKYRLRLARYPALVASTRKCLESFGGQPAGAAGEKYPLLDVGVGHGRTFKYLEVAGIANKFSWHGIDITHRSPEVLSGGETWAFKQANVEEGVPFEDGYFSIVIAEQILEHLRDVDFALAELSRVTRAGGYLIIGVPVFTCPVASLRNLYIRRLPGLFERSGSGHVQSFCKESIIRRIEADPSLKVIDTRGFRIISGGFLRPLENYHWWYRLSCWLGRRLPSFCTEIQMLVEKRHQQALHSST